MSDSKYIKNSDNYSEGKKVLLSVKDLEVKFRVRSRVLTAIRGISLDIYENEAIAIVGESGSGKSVFTKTFAGMLESNGFISNGKIIFDDEELANTDVNKNDQVNKKIDEIWKKLNAKAVYESGSSIYREILELDKTKKSRETLDDSETESFDKRISNLEFEIAETFNLKQTYDSSKEKDKIKEASAKLSSLKDQLKKENADKDAAIKARKAELSADKEFLSEYNTKREQLLAEYNEAIKKPVSKEITDRNLILAKEVYLSVGRFGSLARERNIKKLIKALGEAMKLGIDLSDDNETNEVFNTVVFRVRYIGEDDEKIHGKCILDLTKIKYAGDWSKIRGARIATVFQDPMTSLNPIITIGKQITSIILKHQNCSEAEARERAIILMKKVGIPNAENRFDDYPFQYSGGMRQRIVIAIALSCQPKILICDEPTTALDVTIQAQILKLLKDLQKEFNYTIVFITHDLGVVANIADRVAVMYAGQIVELGMADEIFFDPRHPYTWALLSSLPQLAERNTKLYSITGTPPSLYNKIVGDPFAPRNPYCLKIDTVKDSPMFKITETHYAKTWLLDPRAPKVEKPDIINDIHQKLIDSFNISTDI